MAKGCTLMKTKSGWVSWRMAGALLVLPLLGMTTSVFAAAPPATTEITTLNNGTVEYFGTSAETFVEANNLSVTGPVEEVIVPAEVPSTLIPAPQVSSEVSPEWLGSGVPYVTDLSSTAWIGGNLIGFTGTNGPGTLTLSINHGISTSWSASGGVSAGVVSGAVGFNVGNSYAVTVSDSVHVPSGQTWTISAYPVYSGYTFQVWVNPFIGAAHQVGSGYAGKPISAVFVVSE
jgi:hypothetical protein